MYRFGWLKDEPDSRDFAIASTPVLKELKSQIEASKAKSADLRQFCSPIEDQGNIGSCTAQAASGMMEFYEKKSLGNHIDASRLFIYKVTRLLMKETGDTGAYLRTTMKALAHFGVCPEEFWPYKAKDFDKEPGAFHYAYAQAFKGIEYYRLDTPDKSKSDLLSDIKKNLANNLPLMFGFYVYSSISKTEKDGLIPFPEKDEKQIGGHAVMAVGFDDDKKIGKNQGALLIRNSWGTKWGEQGYGWLPYEYVLKGLAEDFWALMKAEYIEGGLFD
jgi:C1A family cysteine protease